MSDTPETDKLWNEINADDDKHDFDFAIMTEHSRKLERERNELAVKLATAQVLENAIDVIMAAPLPDILRLFRERGVLATLTTTARRA